MCYMVVICFFLPIYGIYAMYGYAGDCGLTGAWACALLLAIGEVSIIAAVAVHNACRDSDLDADAAAGGRNSGTGDDLIPPAASEGGDWLARLKAGRMRERDQRMRRAQMRAELSQSSAASSQARTPQHDARRTDEL
jgi:hypothetical protein